MGLTEKWGQTKGQRSRHSRVELSGCGTEVLPKVDRFGGHWGIFVTEEEATVISTATVRERPTRAAP